MTLIQLHAGIGQNNTTIKCVCVCVCRFFYLVLFKQMFQPSYITAQGYANPDVHNLADSPDVDGWIYHPLTSRVAVRRCTRRENEEMHRGTSNVFHLQQQQQQPQLR